QVFRPRVFWSRSIFEQIAAEVQSRPSRGRQAAIRSGTLNQQTLRLRYKRIALDVEAQEAPCPMPGVIDPDARPLHDAKWWRFDRLHALPIAEEIDTVV